MKLLPLSFAPLPETKFHAGGAKEDAKVFGIFEVVP
jgi:hypothetical protein